MVCVFVAITATGEVFKNGLVDADDDRGAAVAAAATAGDDDDGGGCGGGAMNDDICGLFASLALNSALNIFIDGTLIFCIVPRVSEKWVTVTVSAAEFIAPTPFTAAVVTAAGAVDRSSVC